MFSNVRMAFFLIIVRLIWLMATGKAKLLSACNASNRNFYCKRVFGMARFIGCAACINYSTLQGAIKKDDGWKFVTLKE